MSSRALLFYAIEAGTGFNSVVELCNFISKQFVVRRFSSVFKRKHVYIGESSAEYCGVVEVISDKLSSEEFLKFATLVMSNYQKRSSIQQLLLLAHGDEVKFTPYGPLPHPQLLQDQLVLICAAEVAEDWVHPVTHSKLSEMLSKQDKAIVAEFIAQGKTLGLEAS